MRVKRSSEQTGWRRDQYESKIDIRPRGEEDLHIPEGTCACKPRLSRDTTGTLMIIHNSWDGREHFERAEELLPEGYQGRRAA